MNNTVNMNDKDDSLDDEDIWIQGKLKNDPLGAQLRDLEHSLRCLICREFLHLPVTVQPCGHIFCAECVRNSLQAGLSSMKRQACCPVCRTVVETKGSDWDRCLLANPAMEKTTKLFQSLRKGLCERLQGSSQQNNHGGGNIRGTDEHVKTTVRSPHFANSMTTLNEASVGNDCDDSRPLIVPQQPKRRIVYSYKKKKQLQDLCASEGLSTAGNEEALINRHELFVTLYNSYIKGLEPKSSAEIVAEVHRRESALRQAQDPNASRDHEALKRMVDKVGNNNDSKVELRSGDSNWDAKFNRSFAKLIARGRANRKEEQQNKPSTKESNNDEEINNSQILPIKDRDNLVPQRSENLVAFNFAALTDTEDQDVIDKNSRSPEMQTTDKIVQISRHKYSNDDVNISEPFEQISETIDTLIGKEELIKPKIQTNVKVVARVSPSLSLTNATQRKRTRSNGCVGPWTCPKCTYINNDNIKSTSICEMCGEFRPFVSNKVSCNDIVDIT